MKGKRARRLQARVVLPLPVPFFEHIQKLNRRQNAAPARFDGCRFSNFSINAHGLKTVRLRPSAPAIKVVARDGRVLGGHPIRMR
jgi:hypothetical protein